MNKHNILLGIDTCGAFTGFVLPQGDTLNIPWQGNTISRQARRELYNLQPKPVAPPAPRELCLETGGRVTADGTTIEPLTSDDLALLRQQLQQLNPKAIAINLLFSFLDDTHEKAISSRAHRQSCPEKGPFNSWPSEIE